MLRFLTVLWCALALASCGASNENQTKSEAAPAAESALAPQNGFGVATVRVTYTVQGPGPMRGISTLWIEDSGARGAIREELAPGGATPTRVDTFWNGERSFVRNGDQPVASTPFRPIFTEASAMARSSESERAAIGWTAQGQRTVAGQTCDVWRNENMGGIELCVWRGVDLEEISGAQRRVAIEVVEGERIPAEISALAN